MLAACAPCAIVFAKPIQCHAVLGWFWLSRSKHAPGHRTDLPSQHDPPSVLGDPQSRLAAASRAIRPRNKLPSSLLCLLVSQPTHLGLALVKIICSPASIFI